MADQFKVARFGGDWFEMALYSTPELIQVNGRIPERVVARQLSASFEDAETDHIIHFDLDGPDVGDVTGNSGCTEPLAMLAFGEWLFLSGAAPVIAADANLLLMNQDGGACSGCNGRTGTAAAANITADPGVVVRQSEPDGDWGRNVSGAMHEVGRQLGVCNGGSMPTHPGLGWNIDLQEHWHRTPNQNEPGITNFCGFEIPERTYTTTVSELWMTSCFHDNATLEPKAPLVDDNQPPTADFTTSTGVESVALDASAASDPDGLIDRYDWQLSGALTASTTGQTVSVSVPGGGSVTIDLTVTDDAGATDTATESVVVPGPENQPPTARFTGTTAPERLTLDASESSDPDGQIATYDWRVNIGADTRQFAGQQVTVDVPGGGDVSVTLTVTDTAGATDSHTEAFAVGPTTTRGGLAGLAMPALLLGAGWWLARRSGYL